MRLSILFCHNSSKVFQPSDFERTCWRLFQKRVVRTKLDIYVFITWYREQISQIISYTIIHMTRWYTYKNKEKEDKFREGGD
jgi:hypothetical protein